MGSEMCIRDRRQGGAERVISSLANELDERKHRIIIYTLNSEESFYKLNDGVQRITIHAGGKGILKNMSIISGLKHQLKRDRPDVLIAFDSRTLVYSILARVGKLAIVYSERSNPEVYPTKKVWRYARNWAMKKAELCVFQTASVAAIYPELSERSVVIPNAIFNPALKRFSPPKERENCISAMGRLDCSIKGFDKVICAFEQVAQEFPGVKLKIYGNGKDREFLQNIAEEMNLEDRVEIVQGNENAILEVAKSRLFILFSYFEGFPNALIEAMACGIPCISSDCNYGPRDIITHGSNGCLVKVGDIDALAQEMRNVLGDQKYAKALGCEAKITSKKYALPVIVTRWEDSLYRILGDGSNRV